MFDIKSMLEPINLTDALNMLSSNPKLKVIAGGSDVLIRLHHGNMEAVELLSLRKIKALDEINIGTDGSISIGAMSSFSTIFRNELINKYIPILAEAAVSMGGPQIRNIATIGGNICNGAVSADSAPALFSLNTFLKLVSANGERLIPIQEFYEGPGKVKLLPGEILTSLIITRDNYLNMSGKYIKFSERKAMDIAKLSVAVLCDTRDGMFKDVRIALGVAAPTPIRCIEAENYAKDKPICEETINEISSLTLKSAKARDSWRGSKAYREHLIQVLTERAIKEIIKKSGGLTHE